ncbi:MAG: transporter substrate-binding domain-containing protein [Chitinispirillales bacterium]|nr:transporter substrate-binding domain-containing protein [Chitinispirillales bacterium]
MNRLIFALIFVALYVVGCAQTTNGSTGGSANGRMFTSFSDFIGARVASEAGSVFSQFIDPVIPGVRYKYFSALSDALAALTAGKVDAVTLDLPVAMYTVARDPTFAIFPFVLAEDRYGFAVAKGSELGVRGNEILKKLLETGIVCESEQLWFSADEDKKALPKLEHRLDFDGTAGTIRYGHQSTMAPMSYYSPEAGPLGFDLDIVSRIAYEMNMNVEFVSIPSFDALLPALASGKVNMVGGSMSITEERLRLFDFIGPYFEGGTAFLIKKSRMGES